MVGGAFARSTEAAEGIGITAAKADPTPGFPRGAAGPNFQIGTTVFPQGSLQDNYCAVNICIASIQCLQRNVYLAVIILYMENALKVLFPCT